MYGDSLRSDESNSQEGLFASVFGQPSVTDYINKGLESGSERDYMVNEFVPRAGMSDIIKATNNYISLEALKSQNPRIQFVQIAPNIGDVIPRQSFDVRSFFNLGHTAEAQDLLQNKEVPKCNTPEELQTTTIMILNILSTKAHPPWLLTRKIVKHAKLCSISEFTSWLIKKGLRRAKKFVLHAQVFDSIKTNSLAQFDDSTRDVIQEYLNSIKILEKRGNLSKSEDVKEHEREKLIKQYAIQTEWHKMYTVEEYTHIESKIWTKSSERFPILSVKTEITKWAVAIVDSSITRNLIPLWLSSSDEYAANKAPPKLKCTYRYLVRCMAILSAKNKFNLNMNNIFILSGELSRICPKKTRDSLEQIVETNHEALLLKPKRKQSVLDAFFKTPMPKKPASLIDLSSEMDMVHSNNIIIQGNVATTSIQNPLQDEDVDEEEYDDSDTEEDSE